jgi:simple sugar transport system substrate-binding protein
VTADRAAFLRRAGIGAAGVSLGSLLGPAAALAGDGGGDYPPHPRWRFVFVSYDTLDPLLVATQFGAEDAASLVRCTTQWTGSPRGNLEETVKAFRAAVAGKADGIAVSLVDRAAFGPDLDAAHKAGIPVVAFGVDSGGGHGRVAYVGETPYAAGLRAGAELARLAPGKRVLVFAPETPQPWVDRRLAGVGVGLTRTSKPAHATVVRLSGLPSQLQAQVQAALASQPDVRGLVAVDGDGTLAVGTVVKRLGLAAKGVHAGGFDLLPTGFALVSEGHLDFAVDQQTYVQGFSSILQLFVARISEGTVFPWDADTSVLLQKGDVGRLVETKSRFEGSSSRHEYPLRRG